MSKVRRVPAGTFDPLVQKGQVKTAVVGRSPTDPLWDWRNPYDNPSGKKPRARRVNPTQLKAKATAIVAKMVEDTKDCHEIGPIDLIDEYVNRQKAPELWIEVHNQLLDR